MTTLLEQAIDAVRAPEIAALDSEKPIGVRATVGLVTELRDALEKVGEDRFPYIKHHFDERQQTAKYP